MLLRSSLKSSRTNRELITRSIAVLGNTTSCASDLTMTNQHLQELEHIETQYREAIFAFQLCPSLLFAEIIRINRLRRRATQSRYNDADGLLLEGLQILCRIRGFSPRSSAETKPSRKEDWELVGNIYQAAVGLFCILSLQSLSVLPLSVTLRHECAVYGQILHARLAEAVSSPRIKRFMLWPLVVLGVEATNGGVAVRTFVVEKLPELSRYAGVNAPLTAKAVLERFWSSGKVRWDECFDRPYAFVMQIAVEQSRLPPPE